MSRTWVRVFAFVGGACALLLLAACGGPKPATISGLAFRDHNANGAREAREPGEPGITVEAYDAEDRLVASTATDIRGEYVLNAGLERGSIVEGEAYVVVFSGLAEGLQPGPAGQDSGTDLQFVTGGETGVNFGVHNPKQYVP